MTEYEEQQKSVYLQAGSLYLLGPAHWVREALWENTGSVRMVALSTSARTEAWPSHVILRLRAVRVIRKVRVVREVRLVRVIREVRVTKTLSNMQEVSTWPVRKYCQALSKQVSLLAGSRLTYPANGIIVG